MRHDFPLMLFAAGFGTRMGALTADRPKPLIEVAGKPLIDHALAQAEGVGRIVANVHYRPEALARHLEARGVAVSREDPILETGGGLRTALPLLGEGPVMTLNTDAVWTGENPLSQLQEAWDPARMDGLLLLLPDHAVGKGAGDFVMDAEGRLNRAKGARGAVYLGAQILRPEGLLAITETVFSVNLLWDRMIAKGRLFGVRHRGQWCDVGHPAGIADAEKMLGYT
ncbi:nucleotidyltransferase family protein [Paragemmobacter straminiformis]|uniref:Nucleotidyltransferase family protein n=1 Tax=Paragemmobacter straminiformis TaxID=2045119 RepID=A0A842I8W3_9RHOB|nr:nucleotidyltransferase family protein [Gemmobacter straminiformis]MBC2836021.1 nucleotidyltransferase family protein [Gemmobacter straminiformis]